MKLSIITINYNNKSGLQKTINSVINQTYTNYEYIIIDGGSIDGSKEVMERYEDKITYWVSEPDKGIYNAMNKGIREAKGEYCFFLNSGDWLINNNILSLVFYDNIIDEDIVYGDIETSIGKITYPERVTLLYFIHNSICHQASFIKRSLFQKYGFYSENYKIISDWEFFVVCIIKNNNSYKKIAHTISHYDIDGVSSNNLELLIYEREIALQKLFPLIYEDYINYITLRKELKFYLNSRIIQLIKRIQKKYWYKKLRRVK